MDLNYVLRAKKFKAKKSLGQNFLISEEVIDFIADQANKEDEILEIGAGLGFVTEKLVQIAKNVVALEIDKDAIVTYSKAFSIDHPEIKRVKELGLKIIHPKKNIFPKIPLGAKLAVIIKAQSILKTIGIE